MADDPIDLSAPSSLSDSSFSDPASTDHSSDAKEIDNLLPDAPDENTGVPHSNVPSEPGAGDLLTEGERQQKQATQQKTVATPPAKQAAPVKPTTPVKPAAVPTTPVPNAPKTSSPQTQPTPVTVPPATPPADDELDKIKPPPGLSPRNMENWEGLRTKAKEYKNQAKTAIAESTKIKQQLTTLQQQNQQLSSGAKLPEPVQKELGDLRTFRTIFAMQNAPEFVEKYDKQIVSTLNDVNEVIRSVSNDNFVNELKEKGGVLMAKVNEPMRDPATGKNFIDPSTGKEQIFSKPFLDSDLWNQAKMRLDPQKRFEIERSIQKAMGLAIDRKKEMDAMPAKVEEFQKARATAAQTAQKQWESNVETYGRNIQAANPFAQERPLTGNETPEQKAEIEAHNLEAREHIAGYTHIVNALAGKVNPQFAAEIAAAVRFAYHYDKQNAKLFQENAAMKQEMEALRSAEQDKANELAKIRGSARTSNSAVATPPTNGRSQSQRVFTNSGMRAEDELEQAMNENGAARI